MAQATLRTVQLRASAGIRRFRPFPPDRLRVVTVHNIADEREVLWRMIEAPARIREEGRKLWPVLQDFNRYWPEFRSFVDQARRYDDAAQHVTGASAALLSYYCALNLAKAELLRLNPAAIYRQRIGHGLSYNPARAKGLSTEVVRVQQDGVFPMLYAARTGGTLAQGEELSAVSLLRSCSDIGAELGVAGFQADTTTSVAFLVGWDADNLWYSFALYSGAERMLNCRTSQRYLAQLFDRVENANLPPFTTGVDMSPIEVLQSKQLVARQNPGADGPFMTEVHDVQRHASDSLREVQSIGLYGFDEWSSSLWKTRWLPMRSDLGRYAAMFYCSSVARYRPSMIYDKDDGRAAWVLGAFVEEARLNLLRDFVGGVTGVQVDLSTSPPGSTY